MSLKTIFISAVTITALAPKGLYYVSTGYIEKYHRASQYLTEQSNIALSYVGLETVNQSNPESIDYYIQKHATLQGINPLLVRALMHQESSGNSDAYSSAGAIGLLQIMPANASRCGFEKVSKLWDDENNIKCGTQIIKEELSFYKGNLNKALQCYNAGTSKVNRLPAARLYAEQVISRFAQLALNTQIIQNSSF